MRRRLPSTVLALGVVSLLADVSSEMVYPQLPLFLTTVLGVGALSLGLIEGVAEATASIVKLLSGAWSDRLARRKPLILAGYGVSAGARPLIGLAGSWPVVLALRFVDRFGKGVRGAPRDAVIAEVTPAEQRGAAYGLHRSMDHVGAVLGPLAAAALLMLPAIGLREVFLLSLVPGALSVMVLAFWVKEPARTTLAVTTGRRLPRPADWRRFPPALRGLFGALGVLSLGSASDAFFLLRLGHGGWSPSGISLLWAAHHVAKSVAALVGGKLADRRGRLGPMVLGWGALAAILMAFAGLEGTQSLAVAFVAYGLCVGLAEPAEKAAVADLAPGELKGTAFGFYNGARGVAALPASLLFGALWTRLGPEVAFGAAAGLVMLAILILLVAFRRSR